MRVSTTCCPASLRTTFMRVNLTRPCFLALISLSSTWRAAVPPMWKVRIVNCVPGSPMLWAAMMPTAMPSTTAMMPTAMPSSTSEPVERSMP